jgi:hypothetical protein
MPALDRPAGDVDVGRSVREFDDTPHIVQGHIEEPGQKVQGVDVDGCGPLDVFGVARVTGRATPSELVLVGFGRPKTQVYGLEDAHVMHLAADAGRDGRQIVAVSGVDTTSEKARVARTCRLVEGSPRGLTEGAAGDKSSGGHDVDAGAEQTRHVLDLGV